MLTFLFWNLKRENADVLVSIVKTHAVDVLILAECPMLPATILEALNRPSPEYFYMEGHCDKLQLYTRFSDEYVLPLKQGDEAIKSDDFSVRRLVLLGREELLLCAVHFPSKLRQLSIDQTLFTVRFAAMLAEAELAAGHNRTVLVGDLNMNPYEDGIGDDPRLACGDDTSHRQERNSGSPPSTLDEAKTGREDKIPLEEKDQQEEQPGASRPAWLRGPTRSVSRATRSSPNAATPLPLPSVATLVATCLVALCPHCGRPTDSVHRRLDSAPLRDLAHGPQAVELILRSCQFRREGRDRFFTPAGPHVAPGAHATERFLEPAAKLIRFSDIANAAAFLGVPEKTLERWY